MTAQRWPSEPLTTVEAERLLIRCLAEAEDAVEEFGAAAGDAARAESEYRRAKAATWLRAPQTVKTGEARTAYATETTAALLTERDRTAAVERYLAEVCRIRRAAIEAVRSLVASARAAETGRG